MVMEGGREDEEEEPVIFLIRPPIILSGVGRASKNRRVWTKREKSQLWRSLDLAETTTVPRFGALERAVDICMDEWNWIRTMLAFERRDHSGIQFESTYSFVWGYPLI